MAWASGKWRCKRGVAGGRAHLEHQKVGSCQALMRLGVERDHVLSLRALETKCDVFRANLERISVDPGQAL